MREADEHIRSAVDAAGEVYDDDLLRKDQEEGEEREGEEGEEEGDDGDNDDVNMVSGSKRTTTALFPSGPISPLQAAETQRQQSCYGADQTNASPANGHLISREHPADEDVSLTLDSGSAISQSERDDTGQPMHAHNLSNDAVGRNEAHSTEQSDSRRRLQNKRLTHQQVRNEAVQRRKSMIIVRSQLERQEQGGGLTQSVHQHAYQDLRDQSQRDDVERGDVDRGDVDCGDVDRSDVEQGDVEHRDGDQWCVHDQEDNVESGMRKAEEHMRSAEDVTSEVYDDDLLGNEQEKEYKANDNGNTVRGQRNTTTTMFPGGPIEQLAHSSGSDHVLVSAAGSSMVDGLQTEARD